ncbi:MAG: SCO family protein [Flavobacteriales bacterium]|jgi:protein SCO1|nr:SCO family protein [Flavobacteriales bacterium]
MTKRIKQLSILFFILVLPSLIYVFLANGVHRHESLPFIGEYSIVNGDTVQHTIADFSFTNQFGETITQDSLFGDIIIADFFFSTCGGICPEMSKQMMVVQENFRDINDIKILSHTVNPEFDNVDVLRDYAEQYGAMKGKWHFVTGDKEQLYKMGVNSYLIPTQEDVLAPGGFLHSEMFVLIDRQQHIRGFFDGTNSNQVRDLINAVKFLKSYKGTSE